MLIILWKFLWWMIYYLFLLTIVHWYVNKYIFTLNWHRPSWRIERPNHKNKGIRLIRIFLSIFSKTISKNRKFFIHESFKVYDKFCFKGNKRTNVYKRERNPMIFIFFFIDSFQSTNRIYLYISMNHSRFYSRWILIIFGSIQEKDYL